MDNEDLFIYNEEWDTKYLAPELLLTNYNYKLLATEHGLGIFTLPIFSKLFCQELLVKLKNFTDWETNRHKTYPTNDILIEKFDTNFSKIYDSTLRNILVPALTTLYDCPIGNFIHETFIIRYRVENQSHLDIHHDSSSFTVCVTFSPENEYEGGGTYFPQHKLTLKTGQGTATIHPGKFTHKHGVKPIISGERYAMVSFCKLIFT